MYFKIYIVRGGVPYMLDEWSNGMVIAWDKILIMVYALQVLGWQEESPVFTSNERSVGLTHPEQGFIKLVAKG